MSRSVATLRRSEAGSAMAFALLSLLLISMLIGVVILSTISTIDRVKNKGNASTGLATADRAIVVYQYALQARLATEGTYYAVNQDDLNQAALKAGKTGSWTLLNSDLPKSFKDLGLDIALQKSLVNMAPNLRPEYQVTVRERISASTFGYWQLMEVVQPDFSSGDSSSVVAYLRAWTADTNNRIVAKPRIIRAEYRPGRFADYQMISDGPIDVNMNGLTIGGPLHTNGYRDRYMSDDSSGILISSSASKTKCDTKNGDPTFTTTRGPINVSASKSCSRSEIPKRANTNIEISFLRVEDSFRWLRETCEQRAVVCPFSYSLSDGSRVPKSGIGDTYQVRLAYRAIYVNGVRFPAKSANETDVRAFYFPANVRLSGTYDGGDAGGRITIAAERRNAYGKAAEITLDGGASGSVGAKNSRDIVGIMAQGNIELGGFNTFSSTTRPPHVIRAALIAESGAVSLPEQWLTAGLPPIATTPRLRQSRLSIHGSIAGHFSPTFVTQWTNSYGKVDKKEQVGYQSRKMFYNYRLYKNPPPYFPLTGPWQVTEFSNANYDCVTRRELDAACR